MGFEGGESTEEDDVTGVLEEVHDSETERLG